MWIYVSLAGLLIGFCFLYLSPGGRIRAISFPSYITLHAFFSLSFAQQIDRLWTALCMERSVAMSIAFLAYLLDFSCRYFFAHFASKLWRYLFFIGALSVGGVFDRLLFKADALNPLMLATSLIIAFVLLFRRRGGYTLRVVDIVASIIFFIYALMCLSLMQLLVRLTLRTNLCDTLLALGLILAIIEQYHASFTPLLRRGVYTLALLLAMIKVAAFINFYYVNLEFTRLLTSKSMAGEKDLVIVGNYYHKRLRLSLFGKTYNIGDTIKLDMDVPCEDKDDWVNVIYARYYNLNSLVLIKPPS